MRFVFLDVGSNTVHPLVGVGGTRRPVPQPTATTKAMPAAKSRWSSYKKWFKNVLKKYQRKAGGLGRGTSTKPGANPRDVSAVTALVLCPTLWGGAPSDKARYLVVRVRSSLCHLGHVREFPQTAPCSHRSASRPGGRPDVLPSTRSAASPSLAVAPPWPSVERPRAT